MQNLPTAEVYAQEVKYMPWGKTIEAVLRLTEWLLPRGGRVLDLMCGTGNLLGSLKAIRPDIICTGIDLEGEYIDYARRQYPKIEFVVVDALACTTNIRFDAVLCTGGLHHIHWDLQNKLIKNISTLVAPGGFAIVADPYIGDYYSETQRQVAAATLGHQYLCETIKKGAPPAIVKATAELIVNDVTGVEFKTSVERIIGQFHAHFASVTQTQVWPKHPEKHSTFGDYYFLCRNE